MNTINTYGDDYMSRVNFNADDETIEKLDKLCRATERNRTQMLIFLIKQECKRLEGKE